MASHLRGNGSPDFRNLHETHVELEYRVPELVIAANSLYNLLRAYYSHGSNSNSKL